MTVTASATATMSPPDSSQQHKGPNVLPPALETVNEPASKDIATMKYADEDEPMHARAREMMAAHTTQKSVVQPLTAPQLHVDDDEADDDGDGRGDVRTSLDLSLETHSQMESASSSLWDCLCCGCCGAPSASRVM